MGVLPGSSHRLRPRACALPALAAAAAGGPQGAAALAALRCAASAARYPAAAAAVAEVLPRPGEEMPEDHLIKATIVRVIRCNKKTIDSNNDNNSNDNYSSDNIAVRTLKVSRTWQ